MSFAERCLAALAVAVLLLARWSAPARAEAARPRPLLTVSPLVLPVIVRQDVLGSGENLGQLLTRLGVGTEELPVWLTAVQGHLDPRAIPAGLTAESVIDVHGAVKTLRLKPSWRVTVIAERSGGTVAARREDQQVDRELVVVRGTVQSSLFDAVTASGESETLALELADLFQWDIDFHREVRAGDTFAILVERLKSGGRTVAYGPAVAASYVNRGKTFTAVRYAFGGNHPSFYDAHGNPLRKQFLRAPVKFSRITSRYSNARLHPILGVRLPHWGIDYGAPTGTPVMATADGVVSSAGWNGGGGNAVEVRHAGGYVTSYMHLSRFAAAIRPGARVEQGQVIGYVGATGLATGPHVDYRVTQNGRHLNPLGVGRDPAPPMPAGQLPSFTAWAGQVLPLLGTAGPLPAERVAALASGAPVPLHG
ncbi:MAG: peptidoglycan DD-metalloendopeptidase family protein [Acidobacteriia bacterium]|nr:peptidoglycan DD-metalloendopeptidase family protein [Terriglobia bacterium]